MGEFDYSDFENRIPGDFREMLREMPNLYGYEPDDSDLEHISPSLRHLAVPTTEVLQDSANARGHGSQNYEKTKRSLRKWGQRFAIVVRVFPDDEKSDAIGEIEAGNLRHEIFRDMGWDWIAVNLENDDAMEAAAFAIADNRTGELAHWKPSVLEEQTAMLRDEWDDSVAHTGFSEEETRMMEEAETLGDQWGEAMDDLDGLGSDDGVEAIVKVRCDPKVRENVINRVRTVLQAFDSAYIVEGDARERSNHQALQSD